MMKSTRVTATAAAVVLMSSCASAGNQAPPATSSAAAPPAAAAVAGDVVMAGQGRDRTGSRTIDDWATYADHLLVVTVTEEVGQTASAAEIERGGGMIGRTVKLSVDDVLWSAPDAPRAAPSGLAQQAAGWRSGIADATVRVAFRGSSRLEVGHTYVKAVEWADDLCSDDPGRGTWEGLGSGDTIPFDAGVLGAGEFEGRVLTLEQAKERWRAGEVGPPSVRYAMAGASTKALTDALRATTPLSEQDHGPAECDPDDQG